MIFTFIDESGKPEDMQHPTRPTLTAVCVEHRFIKIVTQRLFQIENIIFGEDRTGNRKLKGNNMIQQRSMMPNYSNRKQYTEELIALMKEYEMKVFSIIMETPEFVPYTEPGMLSIQDRLLLERVNAHGASKADDLLVIYDKITDEKDGRLALGFKNFLFKNVVGRRLFRIVEMPLFVSSQTHPLIRFPDLVGNILREYFVTGLDARSPTDDFERWVVDLYEEVKEMTVDVPNARGSIDYGLFEMPQHYFRSATASVPQPSHLIKS